MYHCKEIGNYICDEKLHIFPIESLGVDYLSTDQKKHIIKKVLNELSAFNHDELFMINEAVFNIQNTINKDLFNDVEMSFLNKDLFELCCDLSNIVFDKKCHVGKYRLKDLNEASFIIGYRERIKEVF